MKIDYLIGTHTYITYKFFLKKEKSLAKWYLVKMDEIHTMGSSKFQGYGKKSNKGGPWATTHNCWSFLGSFGSV